VKVYAILSYQVQTVIKLFSTQEEAEVFLAELRADEPELAAMLRVEVIEVGEESGYAAFTPATAYEREPSSLPG
jgi:hypothetical protein